MEAIVNSVNKGAVHRYILKPWDDDMFMDMVMSGLKRYEEMLENEGLIKRIQKQHKNLHLLKQQLMELTSHQYLKIMDMDRETEGLREQLERLNKEVSASECHPDKVIANMESILLKENGDDMVNINRIHHFYTCCIRSIYDEFDGISKRNGFEIPRIIPPQS
jgi:response regulator RpfG family c-di-GMP phosphodiesterase